MALRCTLLGALAGLALGGMLNATAAFGQVGKPPLTMVSFGGAFTRSQMLAYVRPYRETEGRWVTVAD